MEYTRRVTMNGKDFEVFDHALKDVHIREGKANKSRNGKVVRSARDGTTYRIVTKCRDEHYTKRADAESCDINRILAKYNAMGIDPRHNMPEQQFLDLTNRHDYEESSRRYNEASLFLSNLPAKIRTKFRNDVTTFLKFIGDPKNIPELETMGIIKREKKAPPPAATPSAPPAPDTTGAGTPPKV